MIWRPCRFVAPLMLFAYAPAALAQATTTPQPNEAKAQAAAAAPAEALLPPPITGPKGTQLTWLGHAAWLLRSPMGTNILIDPWLDNPKQPKGFTLPEHIDAIVVTHGHADHVGETAALAEKYAAPVVASFELIEALGLKDGIGVNAGGTVIFKDVELHLTQAVHSSSVAVAHMPPPPPEGGLLQGASGDDAAPHDASTCTCPDHGQCAEHHHHDGKAMAHQGDGEGHHEHKHPQKGGDSKRRKHGHDHAKHSGEAQELVVGGKNAAESKGSKESAVDEGLKLAKPSSPNPDSAAESPKGPCNCGPKREWGHHSTKQHLHYAGAPLGVIFKVAMGPTIYHAGDTDVFVDMGLIKRRYEPEVALLPIGGHYTMGPKDAALAASLLGVHDVVPMHYGTSPQLSGTPEELRHALEDDQRMVAPSPGATISYAERH